MTDSSVNTSDGAAAPMPFTMRYVAQLLNLQRLSAQMFGNQGNRTLYRQLLIFRRDNYLELTAARKRAKVAFRAYAQECKKSYSTTPDLQVRVGSK